LSNKILDEKCNVNEMTSIFQLTRLFLVAVLVFPLGVVSALAQSLFLLIPVLSDCFYLAILAPIIVPLVSIGGIILGVSIAIRACATGVFQLFQRLTIRRSKPTRHAAPAPSVQVLNTEGINLKVPSQRARVQLPKLVLRQSNPYPSPPLTSRTSSFSDEFLPTVKLDSSQHQLGVTPNTPTSPSTNEHGFARVETWLHAPSTINPRVTATFTISDHSGSEYLDKQAVQA